MVIFPPESHFLYVCDPNAFDIGLRRQRALITPMQLDFDLKGGPPPKAREIPKPQEPVILTVGALTRKVRGLLESGIGDIWVEGEISNLRRQLLHPEKRVRPTRLRSFCGPNRATSGNEICGWCAGATLRSDHCL